MRSRLRYAYVRALTKRVVERHANFFDAEIQNVYLREQRRTIARSRLRVRRARGTVLRLAGVVRQRWADARETNDEILNLERSATCAAASFWDGNPQ